MARTDTLGHFLTDVADAIRTKTGSSEEITASDFDTEIENIPSGGGSLEPSDVNFYDYDGTLLHSYTKTEFLALTELPANPTHTGLTPQGWNWTLNGAKTYVTKYGILEIGQSYITDDEKTRLYITVDESTLDPTLCLGINGTVTVDWGDGDIDTMTGTSLSTEVFKQHVYNTTGNYIISLSSSTPFSIAPVSRGVTTLLGFGSDTNITAYENKSAKYRDMVYKIELGGNVTFNNPYYTLAKMHAVQSITIPTNITRIGNQSFSDMWSITHITFPQNFICDMNMLSSATIVSLSMGEGSTSLQDTGNPSISSMTELERLTLPDGFSTVYKLPTAQALPENIVINSDIQTGSFGSNFHIQELDLSTYQNMTTFTVAGNTTINKIILPPNITSVAYYNSSSFSNCYQLRKIDLSQYTGITSLPQSTFSECRCLENVQLPPNVSSLPYGVFSACYSLRNISIPQSVTMIGDRAFLNCYSLEHVAFPNNIPSIGSYCFSGCLSLEYIDLSNNTVVPTLANTNAFNNVPTSCKIIVPDSLYEDWIAANNWSTYASYIIKKSDWDAL